MCRGRTQQNMCQRAGPPRITPRGNWICYGLPYVNPGIWVHSLVVRAADCRSAGPWFKSGCALLHSSRQARAIGMGARSLKFAGAMDGWHPKELAYLAPGIKTTFKSPPAQKGHADGHTVSNAPDLF